MINYLRQKRAINKFILPLAILLILTVCAAAVAETLDRIVAKVGSDIISIYDINKLRGTLQAYPNINGVFKNLETDKEKDLFLLDMLINDKLIDKENEKYGISADEEDVQAAISDVAAKNNMDYREFIAGVGAQGIYEEDYRSMIKQQIMKMKFYSRFINSKVDVSDKEILDYFNDNAKLLKDASSWDLFHVFFIKGDSPDKALATAKEFSDKLKNGDDFEATARAFATNEFIKFPGKISLRKDELKTEFRDAVSGLKPGDVTDIIETDVAYNVIMLIGVETISLDSYRERIRSIIQNDKREDIYRSIITKLRQEYPLEIRY